MSNDGHYCAERKIKSKSSHKIMARYVFNGKFSIQEECSKVYNSSIIPGITYSLLTLETSECKIDCRKNSTSKLTPRYFSKSGNLIVSKSKTAVSSFSTRISSGSKQRLRVPPEKLKGLHKLLHIRLSSRVVSLEFPDKSVEPQLEYIPNASFQILEKLQHIVYKTCSNRVSERFLELGHMLFRTVYERRGTELMESLKEEEANKIMQLLANCHSNLKPLEFTRGRRPCYDDEATFVKIDNATVRINVSASHKAEIYLINRHLTMEIPWNVIDLTVGICIDEFSGSYMLYHKMEQALEKLFTKDLRILWKYPPASATFYTRLYGPYWQHYAENLEKCVEAVYLQNRKLSRLRRPDETLQSTTRISLEKNTRRKRVKVPATVPPKHQPELKFKFPDNEGKAKTIIKSVNLTCQPFDALDCYKHDDFIS
ncbi:unnamed protein product [Orchesella dallaii]|uniref:Uncharacterized protein n=1 Tax=Orchesella dallaii TaxID=48710 RepID=A0ABP1QD72_9HEXA